MANDRRRCIGIEVRDTRSPASHQGVKPPTHHNGSNPTAPIAAVPSTVVPRMAVTDIVTPIVLPIVVPIVVTIVVPIVVPASVIPVSWSIPARVIIPIGSIRISVPRIETSVITDIVSAATDIISAANDIVSAADVDPGTVDHHVVGIATSWQVDVVATSR